MYFENIEKLNMRALIQKILLLISIMMQTKLLQAKNERAS